MREITAEWVDKAENDFDVAQLARWRAEEPILDAVCFHCQQCVEKYLKAFLQEQRTRFPFAHALIPLLELCLTFDSEFELLRLDLDHLDGYAVAARYPGVEISLESTDDALAAAARVRSFIRRKLLLD
jgi:HEPN domain-containing protein